MFSDEIPTTVSSETPFLDKEKGTGDDIAGCEELQNRAHRNRSWVGRHAKATICHGIMVSLYVLLTILLWRTPRDSRSRLLYTPIESNIRYIVQEIKDSPRDILSSKYVGPPSPEIDQEWERLARFHNLRITEEEMKAMSLNTSHAIAFARGGGYHGMMGVFHELHCLNRIREATRPEYYYKNMSEAEKIYLAGHTEILRAGSMCRADPMIFPYHWVDANRVPNPSWGQNHECVDWNQFEEWLETRRVDIHAPNVLLHPKYGPTYPGGKKIEEPDGPQWYPEDPE